jgi:hypothetical protein
MNIFHFFAHHLIMINTIFYRYEYDDHYFLTDPREFIYEFFPLQPEWQLLKNPITQRDFEDLPFVRSLFFRYGLYFPDSNTKAVMYTDATGKLLYNCINLYIKRWKYTIYYYISKYIIYLMLTVYMLTNHTI